MAAVEQHPPTLSTRYDSNESTTRQRVVSHGHDSYESNESTTRTSVSQHTACWTLMRCIFPLDNGSYHMSTIRFVRIEHIHNSDKRFSAYSVLDTFYFPLMRCISPFDNGSYHMGTIRTSRTNRQLGQAFEFP